jgi:uncharacterized protein
LSDLTPPEITPPEAPEPAANDVPWGFGDILLMLGLAIPFFIAGFAATYGVIRLAGLPARGLGLLIGQFIGYGFVLVPLWMLFRSRFAEPPSLLLRLSIPSGSAGRAIGYGVLTVFLVMASAAILRTPQIDTPMEELLSDPLTLAGAAVLGVTIGPWFEELFFRGLLQPVMVRHFGIAFGILLSSLPFALLHGPQYGWSWRHVVLITVAGCAFGVMRHKTNSTGAAALMHCAYNGVLFAGFIAAKWAGVDMPEAI